tara:strand:+ start:973 stop:2382 length:1410 start_codon:yes stop_codon:yes gene_type:complete
MSAARKSTSKSSRKRPKASVGSNKDSGKAKAKVDKALKVVARPRIITKLTEVKDRYSTSYQAFIGYDKSGKAKKVRLGSNKQFANQVRREWNKAVEKQDSVMMNAVNSMFALDVRRSLEKIKGLDISLEDCVDFYISHSLPEGGYISCKEAVDKFYEIQSEKKLSDSSTSKKHTNYKTYYKPFADYFDQKMLIELTFDEVKKYFVKRGKNWGSSHHNSQRGYLRRLWNLLAEYHYCSKELNPFELIPKQKTYRKRVSEKVMEPDAVAIFFHFVESRKKWEELALMTLTFFCGIRQEEVSRCYWNAIEKDIQKSSEPAKDSSNWEITVWADQGKTAVDKVNPIPPNAQAWLRLCEENKWREKIVADAEHWKQRMKRLRSAFRDTFGFDVPQNSGRHCYCSYHLSKYADSSLTALRMSHPNPKTLHSYYRAGRNSRKADFYFEIIPLIEMDKRHAQADKDYEKLTKMMGGG